MRAFSHGSLDVSTCDVARDASGITYLGQKARPPFVETRTCFSVANEAATSALSGGANGEGDVDDAGGGGGGGGGGSGDGGGAAQRAALEGPSREWPSERPGCMPALRRRVSVDVKYDVTVGDVVEVTVGFTRKVGSVFVWSRSVRTLRMRALGCSPRSSEPPNYRSTEPSNHRTIEPLPPNHPLTYQRQYTS